jgi:hypothetical protein
MSYPPISATFAARNGGQIITESIGSTLGLKDVGVRR